MLAVIINIGCDNESAIQLAFSSGFHEKEKCFEIYVHFIWEKFSKGILNVEKVLSEHQHADFLAKALSFSKRVFLCQQMGLIDPFQSKYRVLLSLRGVLKYYIRLSNLTTKSKSIYYLTYSG